MNDTAALVDFLRHRLDADVAAARRSMTSSWSVGSTVDDVAGAQALADAVVRRGLLDSADAVEREGRTAYADTVRRRLAEMYADHPDFRPEWRTAAAVG